MRSILLAGLVACLWQLGCSSSNGPPQCQPACRSGFKCVGGTCVSACNPECPPTQECVVSASGATCFTLVMDAGTDSTDAIDSRPSDAPGDANQTDAQTDSSPPDTPADAAADQPIDTSDGSGDASDAPSVTDGGSDGPSDATQDTAIDLPADRPWPGTGSTRGRWTNLTPAFLPDASAPPDPWPMARQLFSTAYDSDRERLVMFGGTLAPTRLDDVWEWSSRAMTWANRTPTPRPTMWPSARDSHEIVYDSARGRTVLFAGWDGGPLGDVWEWNGTAGTWERRSESDATLGNRNNFGLTYDSNRNRTVLFGGVRNVSGTGNAVSETWEWNGATGTWTTRTPTPLPTSWPPARTGPNFVFDSARGLSVLFGGQPTNGGPAADTWEWNGAAGTWMERPAGSTNPPAAQETFVAFDSGRARTVVFLKSNNTAPPAVWEWDGTAWADVSPVSGPAPFASRVPRAAYDSVLQRVLVFGGGQGHELWAWQGP